MFFQKTNSNLMFCSFLGFALMQLLFFARIKAEVFEQSMFFYHPAHNFVSRKANKLGIGLDFCVSTLRAKESFNKNGKTVPLFGRFGKFLFNQFSQNSVGTSVGGPSIYQACPETKAMQDNIEDLFSLHKDHKIYCGGRLECYEFAIGAKVSLNDLPLFVGLDIPFRSISCSRMGFCDAVGGHDKYTDFLNTSVDKVLLENCFEPLSNNYKVSGLSDVVLKVGWQWQERFLKSFVRSTWYNASVGVIVPCSMMFQSTKNYLFHIPLGSGGFLGATLKYELGVEFTHNMELVLFGENNFFLNRTNNYKVLHNKNMRYFNLFREREVNSRKGSYWTLGGHLKTKLIFDGLFLMLGYSYHSQEPSYFENEKRYQKQEKLVDLQSLNQFLASNTTALANIEKYDRENRYFYTVNEKLINKDPRLRSSNSHILHFSLYISPAKSLNWCDDARCFISYHQPFFGKSSFSGIGFSGQVGMGANFKF